MIQYYDADGVQFTIDNISIRCLIGVTLSERTDSIEVFNDNWQQSDANMQSYTIQLNGIDLGGFEYLRTFKRSRSIFTWTLTDYYGIALNQQGSCIVESISRNDVEGENITFSATLRGIGLISVIELTPSYILQEDDFFILQEDDFKIQMQ